MVCGNFSTIVVRSEWFVTWTDELGERTRVGPFATEEARDRAAKRLRAAFEKAHGEGRRALTLRTWFSNGELQLEIDGVLE